MVSVSVGQMALTWLPTLRGLIALRTLALRSDRLRNGPSRQNIGARCSPAKSHDIFTQWAKGMSMLQASIRKQGPLAAAVERAYRERVAAGIIKPQEEFERKPVVLISTNGGRLVEADELPPEQTAKPPRKKHLAGVEYPTIALIQEVVCHRYGLEVAELVSEDKPSDILHPRQAAIYLARKMTLMSSPEIGRRFGGRDHSTVLHTVKMVEDRRLKNSTLDQDIRTMRKKILAALHGADHFLEYWGA
jgi:hypothetical protein